MTTTIILSVSNRYRSRYSQIKKYRNVFDDQSLSGDNLCFWSDEISAPKKTVLLVQKNMHATKTRSQKHAW